MRRADRAGLYGIAAIMFFWTGALADEFGMDNLPVICMTAAAVLGIVCILESRKRPRRLAERRGHKMNAHMHYSM